MRQGFHHPVGNGISCGMDLITYKNQSLETYY